MTGESRSWGWLRLVLPPGRWRGVVDVGATVRVLLDDGTIWKWAVTLSPAPDVSLLVFCPLGHYSIEAVLAGGQRAYAEGEVRAGTQDAKLEPEAAAPARPGRGQLQGTGQARTTLRDAMGSTGRARFWRPGDDGTWLATVPGVAVHTRAPDQVVVNIRPGEDAPPFLLAEVAGLWSAPRAFMIIPSAWAEDGASPEIQLVVTAGARPPGGEPPPFTVSANMTDTPLAQLAGLLADDDLGTVEQIGPSVARFAQGVVAGVFAGVVGEGNVGEPAAPGMTAGLLAAAGALALLRTRRLDLLGDWTGTVADGFPALPDGPVIRAWHLVLAGSGGPPDAAALLAEGARRGLPVFAASLRLLLDGLRLAGTAEASRLLDRLQPFRQHAVPGALFTAFRGMGPSCPGPPTAPIGTPAWGDWPVSWGNP